MLDQVDLERLAQVGSQLAIGRLASELELIQTVLDTLQPALKAEMVGMLLLEPAADLYYTAENLPSQAEQTRLEQHLSEILDFLQLPTPPPTVLTHHALKGSQGWIALNLKTFIGLPLVVDGRIMGLLFATRSANLPDFTATDLTILAMLCGQLSVTWVVLHLNQQLSAQNLQLQALNQYREEFIRNLSHDLRTPLTCVLG